MVAARWLNADGVSDAGSRLRLIGWLAENNALAAWAEDTRIPESLPYAPDIDAAIAAERADRAKLDSTFVETLNARRTEIAKDIGIR
jgi:hypothetical protein